jgi:ABC-2 type transport system ATP-binding protein
LIADPRVLLLDEPTSALDPGQRARLWEFVGALAQRGTSVLFSTHHLGELRRHATRVIVLSAGELLLDGPPRDLVAAGAAGEQDFEEAFLALLRERGPQA